MSREADVFADALDLSGGERRVFLEQACGADAVLRARVEALLVAHEKGRSFLPGPLAQAHVASPSSGEAEVIPHYRLMERIGEGGCGVVWLAEQGEPLRRQVAVKVIKLGMDTKEVIARFDAERHALAMMDHPNIAHVFDAGATAAGRPFFAMELVRGPRLTEFCDTNRLTMPARLELFVQVCRAIQHAHVKGIIHRDIKPSNVLVASHDGLSVPKVIDFGIAKATAGRLTDHTLYTGIEQMIGTPIYMSPEQFDPAGHDIDTRSDIYSLGVLLYELLSGRPPFDPATLADGGLEGLRRLIRETDPIKPSTRLSALGHDERAAIARQRGTDPQHLVRILRGDLDWIVMRCLEKDRSRRYETAGELARDLEHFLRREPVAARPPGTLYRFARLAARHKVLAASLATAAAILVLVAAGATAVAVRARRAEQAEAQQASRTDLTLGSRLIEDGRVSEGLAFLVRAAQSDPGNHAIGPRLLSVLAYRNFPRPIGRAFAYAGLLRDSGYSADGQQLGIVASDRRYVWSLPDGKLQQANDPRVFFHDGDVVSAWSGDLRRLAAGGREGSIRVWDAASGEPALRPLPHEGSVTNVLFSPDQRWIASAANHGNAGGASVKIWDAVSGELRASLPFDVERREGIPEGGVRFSPDGSRLLVTTGGTQWGIWKVPGGEPAIWPQRVVSPRLNGKGAFSPDGRFVAITDLKGAQLYETATGAPVGPHLDHEDQCGYVAFSRDGTRLATCSPDEQVRLWLLSSLAKPQFVLRHGFGVQSAFFTAGDGHLVTLASDEVVRIWNTATGELAVEPDRLAKVQRMAVTGDGREFVTFGRFENAARRWQMPAGSLAPAQTATDPKRRNVRFSFQVPEAYVCFDDRVETIALPTLRPTRPPRYFPANVVPKAAVTSFDGLDVAAILESGKCELWNLREETPIRHPLANVGMNRAGLRVWFKPGSPLFCAHYHDPESLACRLDFWDRRSGAKIRTEVRTASEPNQVDVSPDDRLVAVGTAGHGVELWDLASGRKLGDSVVAPVAVTGVRFSPDGRLLAVSSGDHAVRFWKVETREAVGLPLKHPYPVTNQKFCSDHRRFVTTTWSEVRVWEIATGAQLVPSMSPRIERGDPLEAMWMDDDRMIATISTKGVVRLFDSATGQLLLEPFPTRSHQRYGFRATDRYVAVNSDTGISIWPLPPLGLQAPVPGWLLRLATATAGGTLDRFAAFRAQPADAETFESIRREIDRLPANAPYVAWGRWILTDPGRRPPSPEGD
ncbi:MAG: protein kinase [Verrucomicrobia bacterium]|nr:protein kinase [Verrucomicrobiota bacterium]